jgi:hypothetical protein
MKASRVIASDLNALNHEMHAVAAWMRPDDWLQRNVPGTNLPAFTFWHVSRVIDSTVHMGIRGVPELISSEPWISRAWARPDGGVGYSAQQADQLAAQVVPNEVLNYADAVRSAVSQWLRSITDDELEAPARLIYHAMAQPAYNTPPVLDAVAPLDGQPTWLILTITCFAHCWAHLEEMRLLAGVRR